MTLQERAAVAARHWVQMTASRKPSRGSLAHRMWTGVPESLEAHNRYATSRAWVPEGSPSKGLAGLAYHHTVGRAGTAFGLAVAWLFQRPLRLTVAAVIATVVTLTAVNAIH